MGAAPLIRFESVTRRFGAVTAVKAVSLDLNAGEMFCLLGPSGCGKTTLMRMLAGFESPDEGRIWLDGQDITDVPPHRRPVNMMFQSYALFPHLDVASNIAFGLRHLTGAERLGRADIARRVDRLLDLVQLGGFGRRKPSELSGGQRQRVALARALARQPKVLLLDEPMAALDRRMREQTQFELMDIQLDLGTTFLVVTHDQDEAMVMADRIGVMEAGSLAQVGRPSDIYERPASRSVAAFIGDVNLFEAVVTGSERDGAWLLEAPACPAGLAAEHPEGLVAGQRVAVAVRPEKLVLERADAPAAPNRMAGVIWDIGYLGDWTIFMVRLPSGQMVRVSRANAERQASPSFGWDEPVSLRFAPGAAMVLAR
ncbi:MAG: ABC transporter ATP-binding protein [Bosea sp.]|nr:ABC transporter ATP-binding protein [Bosea sp. (in: a-proteobacteria)]